MLRDEGCVPTRVRRRGPLIDVQHVVHDGRKKRAVMADEEHRRRGLQEILLEPLRRFQVEVVRRLVQQQHIGRAHELSRQPESPPLPTRQRVDIPRARFTRIEPQAVENGVHPRRDRVSTLALEALQVVAVLSERALTRVRPQCRGLLSECPLQRQ